VKLLLDTHAFLWLLFAPEKLSETAMAACQDPENVLLLSVASLWEMQVKHQLGKLELDLPLSQIVGEQTAGGEFTLLPIEAKHVLALGELPLYHHDPFDRLLMAQARTECAQLVTADRAIHDYAVQVPLLW
jgi:PIN domain nuclease of toxin-antitoxin system